MTLPAILVSYVNGVVVANRGYRKFCQKRSNYVNVFSGFFLCFIVDGKGGERIQIPLTAGHHRPNSETPLKRCFSARAMMAQH